MLERIPQCLLNETNIADTESAMVNEEDSLILDYEDIAELACGYAECMAEAVRYLIQVENYPEHHPAVVALERHLASSYRGRLLGHTVMSRAASG